MQSDTGCSECALRSAYCLLFTDYQLPANCSSTIPTLRTPMTQQMWRIVGMTSNSGSITRRPLGTTGEDVSLIGIGGAHIGSPDEATGIRIVQQAIDAGADFLDNAWEYN